jgi:hypothetical protein
MHDPVENNTEPFSTILILVEKDQPFGGNCLWQGQQFILTKINKFLDVSLSFLFIVPMPGPVFKALQSI